MARDQFLLVVCQTGLDERVVKILTDAGATGYTKFSGASGLGQSGRHEGTPVWPGQNSLILSAVPGEVVPKVLERLKSMQNNAHSHLMGLKVFAFPVQELL